MVDISKGADAEVATVVADEGVSPDGSPDFDGGTSSFDGGIAGAETVIASGNFSGHSSNVGSGTAALVQTESGALELRFASNFSVTRVPAAIVYLSSRDTLGRSPNASTDLNLGRLQNSSGAQTYAVPGTDDGRRYAWIWCQSFAVEIAQAQLVAP